MSRPKAVETEFPGPSSFAPLESPYSGLRIVADRIRANMAQAEKYLAAIERDLATFEAAFRTAHEAVERPTARPAAEVEQARTSTGGKSWKRS